MVYTYDTTKTTDENKVLFDTYQATDSYDFNSLSDADKLADMNTYTRIKLGMGKDSRTFEKWDTAWDNKGNALKEAHGEVMIQHHKDKEAARATLTLPN